MSQFINQMSVLIEKKHDWLNYEDLSQACRILNGNALKLYVYFNSYITGEIIDFSPRKVSNELNISLNGARNAFSELIHQNYLKLIDDQMYSFSSEQKM